MFPKLKKPLKGKRFETISEIKANATKNLKAIAKEEYQDCFKKWKHRLDKCVRWEESIFKGTQTRNFQIKYIFYDLSPRIYRTDLVEVQNTCTKAVEF